MCSYPVRGRAWRRAQYNRAKERVKRRQGYYLLDSPLGYPIDFDVVIGFHARTRCPCSCRGCGNERYYTGKDNPNTIRRLEEASYQEVD